MAASTVDHLLDDDVQRRVRRRRQVSFLVTAAALTAVMGVAVADGVTELPLLGVETGTVLDTADDGTVLTVEYPTATRPALAVPFDVEVFRPGGFDEGDQVTLAFDTHYLELFDLNGILPAPAEETADRDRVEWTFDAPDGDTLRVVYEARVEPGAQEPRGGWIALLDDQGGEAARVDFTTAVRP